MTAKGDLRKVLKALRKQGFDVTEGTKHYIVRKDGHRVSVFPRSPSDWRTIENCIAPCRRAGFIWP